MGTSIFVESPRDMKIILISSLEIFTAQSKTPSICLNLVFVLTNALKLERKLWLDSTANLQMKWDHAQCLIQMHMELILSSDTASLSMTPWALTCSNTIQKLKSTFWTLLEEIQQQICMMQDGLLQVHSVSLSLSYFCTFGWWINVLIILHGSL